MSSKQFSKDLYRQYDFKAKVVAKCIYEDKGYIVRLNPDKYGVDLLVYEGDYVYKEIEASWCNKWEGVEFPFSRLLIPLRKSKFVSDKIIFMMFNRDFTAYSLVDFEGIKHCRVVSVDNKYVKGESNIDCPLWVDGQPVVRCYGVPQRVLNMAQRIWEIEKRGV